MALGNDIRSGTLGGCLDLVCRVHCLHDGFGLALETSPEQMVAALQWTLHTVTAMEKNGGLPLSCTEMIWARLEPVVKRAYASHRRSADSTIAAAAAALHSDARLCGRCKG